jgi:hypothetical protein
MMRRWLDRFSKRILCWCDTLRRDLLTERHAAHRPTRYIPVWEADASQPIMMKQAIEDEQEDLTGRGRPVRSAEDEMANYFIIIHCAKCGTPVQAKRKGSKGKIVRICAACAAALRRRQRAA